MLAVPQVVSFSPLSAQRCSAVKMRLRRKINFTTEDAEFHRVTQSLKVNAAAQL
jgi:hypothetical protein